MNLAKLQEYKEHSGLTSQQIADISAVPLGTVTKILSGTTPNPGIESLAPIVIAVGGSLDEICDNPQPDKAVLTESDSADLHLIHQLFHANNQVTAAHAAHSRHLEKQLHIHQIVIGVLIAFILFFVIYDVTHPSVGFVQYTVSAIAQAWLAICDWISL